MTPLPIVRARPSSIQVREYHIGRCHHGYQLFAIVSSDPPLPVAWHTGPRLDRGTAKGELEDGRTIVQCVDVGGVLERDVMRWLTK